MTITRPNEYDQAARGAGARPRPWPRTVADMPHWDRHQGPSRVLEGEHFPSDILASYLLGALVLVVGIALYHVLGIAHEHLQLRRTGHEPHSAIG